MGHENAWNSDFLELGPAVYHIRCGIPIYRREFGATSEFNVSHNDLLWRYRGQNLNGISHSVQRSRLFDHDHTLSHYDRQDVFGDEKERPGEGTHTCTPSVYTRS